MLCSQKNTTILSVLSGFGHGYFLACRMIMILPNFPTVPTTHPTDFGGVRAWDTYYVLSGFGHG